VTVAVRSLAPAFILAVVAVACAPEERAHAVACEGVIGKWIWFTQGVVTFNDDGTMVYEPGNDGRWECTDAGRGAVTLRWRHGGYVNQMALSQDGSQLLSTDPTQAFVSGRRAGDTAIGQRDDRMRAESASVPVVLATTSDGGGVIARDLPELLKQTTVMARTWRADAVPVALEYQYLDPPNPKMKGPRVKVSFVSPSDGSGQMITVTRAGASTSTFGQPVTWGTLSLLPAFVDLPEAVRIARANGAKTQIDRASLRVWSPNGAPPILAWMVGNKTVNGATGEIIDFDVTGYVQSYNAQWERAAKGLRALMRAARGPSSSGGAFPTFDDSAPTSSEQPYDDGSAARAEHERNAAEARAYWQLSTEDYNRVKSGNCTWSDSSNGHC
jgi:hypothetical protein